MSDAKKTNKLQSSHGANHQRSGSSRQAVQNEEQPGGMPAGKFEMDAGNDHNHAGSIRYLRDTVNDQNNKHAGLDYELMANPVELSSRRAGLQVPPTSEPDDLKGTNMKQARKDTSFDMGSLPSSEDSSRYTNLKDDMEQSADPKGIQKSDNVQKISNNVQEGSPNESQDQSDDLPDMPLMTNEQLDFPGQSDNRDGMLYQDSDPLHIDKGSSMRTSN